MIFELATQTDPFFLLGFLPFLGKAILGGIAGGVVNKVIGGSGGGATQQVLNLPPEFRKQAIENVGTAEKLLRNREFRPEIRYTGTLPGQASPLASQAIDRLSAERTASPYDFSGTRDRISSTLGSAAAGSGQLGATAGGQYLEGRDLEGQIGRATAPLYERFQQATQPALLSTAASTGRFGSSNVANEQQLALQNLGRAVSDTTGDVLAANYARERGLQVGAAGTLGQLDTARDISLAQRLESVAGREAAELGRMDDLRQQDLQNAVIAAGLDQQRLNQAAALERAEFERSDPVLDRRDAEARFQQQLGDISLLDALYRGRGTTTQTQQRQPLSARLGDVGAGLAAGEQFANWFLPRRQAATTLPSTWRSTGVSRV